MRLRWRRSDVGLTLDICGAASGAAQGVTRAVSAYESENLGRVVCVRSGFTHTVLRYVEQLFDLVGCSAGDVPEHADVPPAHYERTGGGT
jgi:hypothetical protein